MRQTGKTIELVESTISADSPYPEALIEIVDSLYDSGKVQEANDLLEFLDRMGPESFDHIAGLLTNELVDFTPAAPEPMPLFEYPRVSGL